MIKFIIITFLFFLFLRLVAPFLLRWAITFFIGKQVRKGMFNMNPPQPRQNPSQGQKTKAGNLNIDYIPEDKTQPGYKGGDYVEYEEVK